MKKYISIILACIILTALSLTGCGKDDKVSSENTSKASSNTSKTPSNSSEYTSSGKDQQVSWENLISSQGSSSQKQVAVSSDSDSNFHNTFIDRIDKRKICSFMYRLSPYHSAQKVTYDTLTNREKILTACVYLDDGFRKVITLDEFYAALNYIFGRSDGITNESVTLNRIIGGYNFVNNEYVIHTDGAGSIPTLELSRIVKAEENNDGKLILYEKYINLYIDGGVNIYYTDISQKTKIGESEKYITSIDDCIKAFGDKVPTYKHTFRYSYEVNNYVYISSEIVK